MTETGKALFSFFNGFGIPAYEENSVPTNDATGEPVAPPYITFTQVEPRWDMPGSVSATVWYRSTSLTDVFEKVDEIKKAVGEGLRIPVEGGCVWLYADSPFAQAQDSGDKDIKAVYLLFGVHALN